MNTIHIPCEAGDVSDGYHTFNELYEHRHLLFINVALAHKANAFKTWKNHKGEEWEGWFILGINTKFGQITYHLPEQYWPLNVKEVESNADYDNHQSGDVLDRLYALIRDEMIITMPIDVIPKMDTK